MAAGIEAEVKLPVGDLPELRGRLLALGAAPRIPRHRESNVLWDDAGRTLTRRGCALRLRERAGEAIVTFKGPAQFSGGVKSRVEHETAVSDAGAAARILEGLGFAPLFRYEKERETLGFLGCEVALDETPIGLFAEIEGEPGAIEAVLAALGLSAGDAITDSYPGLYRKARERDPRLPADMVFAR